MWGGILNAAVKLEVQHHCAGPLREEYRWRSRPAKSAWPGNNFRIRARNSTWKFSRREAAGIFPAWPARAESHVPTKCAWCTACGCASAIWLRPDELHHHDVVHFALDEVLNELQEGKEADVVARLKEHINKNKTAAPKE